VIPIFSSVVVVPAVFIRAVYTPPFGDWTFIVTGAGVPLWVLMTSRIRVDPEPHLITSGAPS